VVALCKNNVIPIKICNLKCYDIVVKFVMSLVLLFQMLVNVNLVSYIYIL